MMRATIMTTKRVKLIILKEIIIIKGLSFYALLIFSRFKAFCSSKELKPKVSRLFVKSQV